MLLYVVEYQLHTKSLSVFFIGDTESPTVEKCCNIWKHLGDKGKQRFCPQIKAFRNQLAECRHRIVYKSTAIPYPAFFKDSSKN